MNATSDLADYRPAKEYVGLYDAGAEWLYTKATFQQARTIISALDDDSGVMQRLLHDAMGRPSERDPQQERAFLAGAWAELQSFVDDCEDTLFNK